MTYVDAGIRTWFEVRGEGEPVVVLHPGGFDSRAMADPAAELAKDYTVFLPDRRGHGRTPDVEGETSFELMGADTAAFLEKVVGGPAHVVGHSDGAVVGLLTAFQRPDLVRSLVFASGVWHHSGWLPGVLDPDPDVREFMRSWHDEVSPDDPAHFPEFADKLDRMHHVSPSLTIEDLRTIAVPTLVMAGDADEMPPSHLAEMYEAIPTSRLAIVPDAGHAVLLDQPELCMLMIRDFLASPSRRSDEDE